MAEKLYNQLSQFQTADNATVSGAATEGTEGGQPTEYLGRNRGAYTQVTQIFHKGVKMSYTSMAAYNQQNAFDLGAAGYNTSDGDGTLTAADKLALFGGNPITDELAEQMELALEKLLEKLSGLLSTVHSLMVHAFKPCWRQQNI